MVKEVTLNHIDFINFICIELLTYFYFLQIILFYSPSDLKQALLRLKIIMNQQDIFGF